MNIVSILDAHHLDKWVGLRNLFWDLDSSGNKEIVLDDLRAVLGEPEIERFEDELVRRGYALNTVSLWSWLDPNGSPLTIVNEADLALSEVIKREWGGP